MALTALKSKSIQTDPTLFPCLLIHPRLPPRHSLMSLFDKQKIRFFFSGSAC
uniref:Uncharacterized protein n=1 Tax=Picea glauca TaxID=3330 RepID=A0A101M5I9_PICGL|nr:hypothetical protein ABT39_MTgene1111 [Picea glauca]QHR87772.1 hypothetical protein Q903MT_gene1784 [Picea sitchensis]